MTTYDVSAIYIGPDGIPIQELAAPNNSGQLVTGSQKLAQRCLCRLLLPLGSIPYLTAGCNFIPALQAGISTEQDIFNAFYATQLNLVPQLKGEQNSTDPLDEQFSRMVLNTVVITSTGVVLNISIISAAGGIINVNLPLTFNIQ